MGFKEELENLDVNKLTIGLTTVVSILRYSAEIIELLRDDKLTDEELDKLTLVYGENMNAAISEMNEALKSVDG